MPRRQSRNSNPRGRRNQKRKSNTWAYVAVGVAAILLIGIVVWLLTRTPDNFTRQYLDRYVELTHTENLLGDGASVYVDMSDGMLDAYASQQSRDDLQAIINKLAADQAIQFYGLAAGQISELNLSHVKLYNYMLDPKSYSQQQAPIEEALRTIVAKKQPALLMSDFEEYNGGRIQKAAYAKKYFVDWLAMGYNITFYKWDFVERGKPKHMFFAVFDDNANRLNDLVDNAVKTVDPEIETFVLGSREFAYPTATAYPSMHQGGNFHAGQNQGKDVVTAVLENGGKEAYISYAKPYATSTGDPGQFAPLDRLVGDFAEYYPIGVTWEDAIKNAKMQQEEGVKVDNQFTHLLSNLFIDFGAQDGYTIDGIEVRVFDVNQLVEYAGVNDEVDTEIATPEVNEVLVAGMETSRKLPWEEYEQPLPQGWAHIYVDFDSQFKGSFSGGIPANDLLRANIVIAKATPNLAAAREFFAWDGNPSLYDSVSEALRVSTSNPAGRILFTYYLKTI